MAKEVPTSAPINFRNGTSKPKQSRHLWVGGLGASETKESLEAEFSKFGKLENIKFIKDRSIAFVNYAKEEDACEALKNLNGRQIGDGILRVDFAKPHPSQRGQQSDFRPRDPYAVHMGGPDYPLAQQDFSRNYSFSSFPGQQWTQPPVSFITPVEPQPSKVLLVRYPPSVFMDEKLLYNSMILYGEIEGIKSSPAKSYTLVVFRSVEEAWRAKESLEGRLLNDPRITITFSVEESAPVNDLNSPYRGHGQPNPGMHGEELHFQAQQTNESSFNRSAGADHLPGAPLPGAPRPFGPVDSLSLSNPAMLHRRHDGEGRPVETNHRGFSPSADGLLPTPVLATRSPHKAKSSGWDVVDVGQISRDSKRPRINEGSPFHDPSTVGKGQKEFSKLEGGPLGPLPDAHAKNRFDSPNVTAAERLNSTRINHDYLWRGVIAKGGTVICQARCVPIRQGIRSNLPEMINCSAKTGLDMLTKHYAEAVGFEASFFLPDSEVDFAPYTEFLHYLSSMNRAGVAKFDDGTTLFLVPPSDFLRKVLNIVGPERLYGVVLKLPHQISVDSYDQQSFYPPLPSGPNFSRQSDPGLYDYASGAHMERDSQLKYDDASELSALNQKASVPSTIEILAPHSISQHTSSDSKSSSYHAGIRLTPELVASLATLLPTSASSVAGQSSLLPQSSVTGGLPAPPMPSNDRATSQTWNQQYQYFPQTSSSQQFENQPDSLAHPATSSHAHSIIPSPSYQAPISMQYQNQNFAYQQPQQVTNPSMIPGAPLNVAQSQNLAAQTHLMEHLQFSAPHYAVGHGTVSTGSYGFPGSQQPVNPGSLNGQIPAATFPHPNGAPAPEGKATSEPLNQVNAGQPVPSSGNQATAEADKDQRYQSTLQFAANLLLQIQQRQQEQRQSQQGAQMGPGGNQQ
ncbi:hypothetical protein Droror1_Dr00001130 [Drosera rotundifolia]